MKRIASQSTHRVPLVFSLGLIALLVFGGPGISRAASSANSTPKAVKPQKAAGHLDARIKQLHAKLKITPAQEDLWNKLVQVMQDNAKTMDGLIKAREKNEKTMNAVEELQSYAAIVQAHADGIRKFIPPFEALYNSMSPAQKKNADTLFRFQGRYPHALQHKKAK